jgi:hypothetical protein
MRAGVLRIIDRHAVWFRQKIIRQLVAAPGFHSGDGFERHTGGQFSDPRHGPAFASDDWVTA